jgi:hypothetical protein
MGYIITVEDQKTGKVVETSLDHLREWFATGFIVVEIQKVAEDKKAS